MEDMDIDQVVEIPDTPDRLSARQVNHGIFCGNEQRVSVAGHLHNSSFTGEECPEQLRNGTRLGSKNGRGRQLYTRPLITPIDIDKCEHVGNNMSENLNASQNAHLFRRTTLGRNSKNEERLNRSAGPLEKGKKFCTEVPHKSSSSLHCAPNSAMTSSNSYKGKEKVAEYSVEGSGAAIDLEKPKDYIDYSQHKHVKEISMPAPSAFSFGAGGRKRLVRKGCISPHNIAIRARQGAECKITSPENVDKDNASSETCHSPPRPVDITDIIADDKDGERVHGRGAYFHPSRVGESGIARHSSAGRNHDGMPCSTATEDTSAASYGGQNALRCFGEIGSWRSPRDHKMKIDNTMHDAGLCLSSSNNVSGCSMDSHSMEQTDNGNEISRMKYVNSRNHPAQSTSWRFSNSDQISGSSHDTNTVIKRQKKHGARNKNRGESSTSVLEVSDMACIDSSRISRNSGLSGLQSSRTHLPVIEIDDLSPVMRRTNSQSIGCVENDDTIARVRQIEADEMLARELQEQLYYEEPASWGGEVDEHIARALQQEEEATTNAYRGRQVVSRPRAPLMPHPHRRSESQPARNTSNRRAPPRAPSSSRMAQLRNHSRRQSPLLPRGGSLLEFPLDMDLDMRIDILEALEAAVGDLDTRLDNHILQFQRDFNENDYEMLLALDENNHHVGASGTEINNLPVSTVQTENLDETCAICLETPSVGDTIRHLPCLHKFHKDCIDPWLSRRTSCPVCKSSIT